MFNANTNNSSNGIKSKQQTITSFNWNNILTRIVQRTKNKKHKIKQRQSSSLQNNNNNNNNTKSNNNNKNSLSRSNNNSLSRSVRFGDVSTREFAVTVGAYSAARDSCPLTLSWEYVPDEHIVSCDEFERKRPIYIGNKNKTFNSLPIKKRRRKIAKIQGLSIADVRNQENEILEYIYSNEVFRRRKDKKANNNDDDDDDDSSFHSI